MLYLSQRHPRERIRSPKSARLSHSDARDFVTHLLTTNDPPPHRRTATVRPETAQAATAIAL
jgi:hypothetical protein